MIGSRAPKRPPTGRPLPTDPSQATPTESVRLKPFLVWLANRHNVLLDLEAGALALWTVGDTARQRTKGKSWFWELAGTAVLDTGFDSPDLEAFRAAQLLADRFGSNQSNVACTCSCETSLPRIAVHSWVQNCSRIDIRKRNSCMAGACWLRISSIR